MAGPSSEVRRAPRRGADSTGVALARDGRTQAVAGLAVALLCGLAWWVGRTVESGVAKQLSSDLQAILDAEVAALRIWATARLRLVESSRRRRPRPPRPSGSTEFPAKASDRACSRSPPTSAI